ncbi:hypothetical protein GH714_011703 [Hevea brasiliensis]|uniref:Disease resistance protein At4g27190-like leucine-rich repeats domain-containing protein n=1 Tax=Hevea brasiliensis TaxID=3981 RepID=A0A6A6KZH0_HEVBR|nr:hypothetical protein GH714_011703 [Hevea brasiliensis]
MKEIILTEESIEEEDERVNKIIFPKLDVLRLRHLSNLIRFCSGYQIEFQSLRDLDIWGCGALMCLVPSVPHTDMMAKQVYIETNHNTEIQSLFNEMVIIFTTLSLYINTYLHGHLKAFPIQNFANCNRKVPVAEGLLQLEKLSIIECGVEEIVAKPEDVEPAPYYCFKFPQLTSLKLIKLSELRSFYPGTHISEWQKLKCLKVRNCRKVRKFGLEEVHEEGQHSIPIQQPLLLLEKMTYFQASKFPELWHGGIQGRLFHNVQSLTVDKCAISDIPVPANLLHFLNKLEWLQVEYCDSAEIVFDLEGLSADDGHIGLLPQLRSSNLECPSLKKLSIYECPSMKNVFGTLVRLHRLNTNDEGSEQRLDNEGFDTPLTTPFCHKFTSRISQSANLVVLDSSLKQLFPCEGFVGDQEDTTAFPPIRALKLKNLDDLKHVSDCQLHNPLFQSLETLEIESCGNFIFLAPSSASFRGLKTLKVCRCDTLINIVTSPTAKSMVQLETLTVKSCNMLTEIVGGDQGVGIGSTDEIVFSKMKRLHLEDLQSLTSFCLGSYTFKFPSLEQLTVRKCPKLRIFTAGVSSTPKLCRVLTGFYHSNWRWEDNLNATIEQLHMKYVGFEGIDDVQLSNFPMLKEKWHGQFPFRNLKHLRNLEELRVEYNTMKDMWTQADFLRGLKGIELTCFSNDSSLLPSYFFQGLPNLEKLVLSDASFEEIIFHEEIVSEEILVKLKELKLSELPRLKHLMDAKLFTVFQYLETLEIFECGRLEILVPSSVSFQNLTTLEVSICQGLVNLISSSTARSLERLRKMKIEYCELIQEIIVTEADKDEERRFASVN